MREHSEVCIVARFVAEEPSALSPIWQTQPMLVSLDLGEMPVGIRCSAVAESWRNTAGT
jgi:hypothetical protein